MWSYRHCLGAYLHAGMVGCPPHVHMRLLLLTSRDESIPKLSEIVREATQPSHHLVAQLTTQQVSHQHFPQRKGHTSSTSLQEEAETGVHRELQAVVSQLPLPDPSTALEPPVYVCMGSCANVWSPNTHSHTYAHTHTHTG